MPEVKYVRYDPDPLHGRQKKEERNKPLYSTRSPMDLLLGGWRQGPGAGQEKKLREEGGRRLDTMSGPLQTM